MITSSTSNMWTNEYEDEPNYEVGQEQLDAVDRMLEELDLDEQIDKVPAAFRIVERLEQQRQQQQHLSRLNGEHHDAEMEAEDNSLEHDESDEDGPEPFGYIPLDQGDESDMEGHQSDGDENDGYGKMQSDGEGDHSLDSADEDAGDDAGDDADEGEGYNGYLRFPNRTGAAPKPVIPAAVEIELERGDRAAEQIPDEDLKTIAMVMGSFALPAPDWARSIPEERWLPRIVQQAEAHACTTEQGDL